MNYWLLKTEPESFSISDLHASPDQTTCWDGVRNYQARNFMRDMKVGDRALFYHSNAAPPAVVGTAVICREAYPDLTQFDDQNKLFDPKASIDKPIWDMVDIRWESTFEVPLPLDLLRQQAKLQGMELLRRGSRLSVQPVSKAHFQAVLALAKTQSKAAEKPSSTAAEDKPKSSPRRKAAKKRRRTP